MKGKGGIVILVLLICALTAVVGLRYYTYSKTDPDFCSTCHLMEEAVKSWGKSKHNRIICEECHRLTLLEENRLLVAFVAGNTSGVRQDHGRNEPWQTCLQCHSQEAAQGSLTLRASYGHARHVFMKNITCQNCHTGDQHDILPDQSRCQNCHKDKLTLDLRRALPAFETTVIEFTPQAPVDYPFRCGHTGFRGRVVAQTGHTAARADPDRGHRRHG